jgi:hypothetical protein
MRPIYWGIIFFVIGLAGWFVSVIFAVVTLGKFRLMANIFGYMFALSLPLALLGELIRWRNKNKK